MLSKYRMEQANPGMERARLTSRLNQVRAEIKEVEAQLEVAKKNSEFDSKHSSDPYWRIAKQKYIETGDPTYIENFRAKQDALDNAAKDRATRDKMNELNENKQFLYDKATALKNIRLAQESLEAAESTQNSRKIREAKTNLEYAKEIYRQRTGEEYKEMKSSSETAEVTGTSGSEKTNLWVSNIPFVDELVTDPANTSAAEIGSEIMKYTDKGGKRFKTEEQKQTMIDWLKSHDEERKRLGIDVDQLEARYSKEVADSKANQKKENINSLKRAYNAALKTNDEAEKERLWNKLEKLGVGMPKSINMPFDI